jgi:hypothetical protein
MTTFHGELLEETIQAHGGRERRRMVERVEFELSSGGFAFLSRSQPRSRRLDGRHKLLSG